MNFALAFLSLVGSIAVSMADDVTVSVDCQGVDYDALTPKSLAFSAKALETAFNVVHMDTDGKTLQDISAAGPTLRGCKNCGGGDDEFTVTDKLRGCKNCGGGDDEVFDMTLAFAADMVQGCKNCGGGDDEFTFVGQAKLAAWQSEFAKLIAKGPHGAFHSVQGCTIDVTTVNAESDPTMERDVTIGVDCQHVDFDNVSVRGLQFSSKALMAAYNTAHKAINDGSVLKHVGVSGCKNCGGGDDEFAALSFSATNVNGCKNCGGGDDMWAELFVEGCKNCGGGDDMIESPLSAMHQMWEKLFTERLRTDTWGELKYAKDCKIKMNAN